MFVVSRALAYGRRAALLTVVGNAAGFYVQVLLVAVGVGALLERSIVAYNTVKFVGALYLVWLGVQTLRRRRDLAQVVDATEIRPHRSILLDGFIVGVSNPKTIVFFAAVLPQYVSADGAGAAVQMAVLGLVFAAVALVSDSVWGLTAGTARLWFARSPRRLERLGGAGGLAIAALGVRLALSGRE
jgi:threonine/homoserine/homoserine lactone efflux protein